MSNKKLASFKQKLTKTNVVRSISGVVVGLLLISLGIGIGDGRIQNGINDLDNSSNRNNLPASLNYAAIQEEYDLIKHNYDGKLSFQAIQNSVQNGLASATGDPYTDYFNASESQSFNDQLNNTFSGIGAELGSNNGNLVVIAPISGNPAAKAGLQPNDVITAINGVSTSGMNADTAAEDIRGPAGTKVTLAITRNNTEHLTLTITRATITLPSVTTKILPGNIGYMQIITFSNDTSGLATQAAQMFKNKGVKGIILDLRDNPGGLVDAAINVSSLWLPGGKTILIQKQDNKVVNTYTATGGDTLNGIPTVVLINDGSASASEITAAALHDNGAAYLIGEKSFGKGTEQSLFSLPNGGEIKITIAHWYTPDNKSIEHIGITPDQTVKLTTADANAGNDTQEAAAISYLQAHN